MFRALSILLFSLGVSFQATAEIKWNNPGTNKEGIYTKGSRFILKAPSHSGFKDHIFFNLPKKEHSFDYIEDKTEARAGKFYQRFELRDGDCFPSPKKGGWNDCETDRERFEFSGRPRPKPSGKQCFGYSIKLDETFKSASPTNTDLGQVHQSGGPTGSAGGFKSFPPLVQIGAKYNRLMFNWHELTGNKTDITDTKREFELGKLDDMKGVWTDISFCLDFKNKRMDAWVNGQKKVEVLRSPINFTPENIYFKHGIYRSFVSKYKKFYGKIPTQIVYYDEVRRGKSVEEVDATINPKLKPVD